MNRRRFIAIAAAASLAPKGAGAAHIWRGVAFGADAQITVRGRGGEAALARAINVIETAEAEFSLYRETSSLFRLNAAGHLAPSHVFRALLTLCDQLHEATGGLFDPTVQPLWRALATGGDAHAAASLIGWRKVEFGETIKLAPGQALTLNGVAQGFATDMVAEALADEGFERTLVNIGEYRAGPGDWRIGVASPSGDLLDVITLSDGAVATSSPSSTIVGGASHILGPAGRSPQWSTVSVQAPTAALADGLSTALCLASEQEIRRIAAKIGGVRVQYWR